MKLTCPLKCGMIMYFPNAKLKWAIKEMRDHTTYVCSKLPQNQSIPDILRNVHRPHKSYPYFLYEILKQRSMIPVYMTWVQWIQFEFPKWARNNDLYSEWKDSLRFTCYNIMCPTCLEREQTKYDNVKRVLMNGGKVEMKLATPRSFIQHASGSIEYLD